jgi:hypothetical protein
LWRRAGFAATNKARAITGASLDPLNAHSRHAPALLRLFQAVLLTNPAYLARLRRHDELYPRIVPPNSIRRPVSAPPVAAPAARPSLPRRGPPPPRPRPHLNPNAISALARRLGVKSLSHFRQFFAFPDSARPIVGETPINSNSRSS